MSAKVVEVKFRSDADGVLEAAKGQLENVVVVGWLKGDGGEPVYVASTEDCFRANWLMDCAKHFLMTVEA